MDNRNVGDDDNVQMPADEIAKVRQEILLISAGLGVLVGVAIYAVVKAMEQQRPELIWVPLALAVIVAIMARGILQRRRRLRVKRRR